MTMRFTNEEVAQEFARFQDDLLDLLREPGELALVPGEETVMGRSQWTVTLNGQPLLALGYTRREAMRSLVFGTRLLSLIE